MSNNRYKILVVEDEANIRGLVGAILETNGYQVLSAGTCAQGELLFSSHLPDLVFLDLGLPDRDGLELIRFVRQSFATPIIVLSARSHEGEKVAALDLGANDYITKPFGTGELLARTRAALRSSRRGEAAAGGSFTLSDLEIRYDQRAVLVGGQEIKLTQTEYNILSLLSEHAGKVLTYSAIIRAVWGSSDPGSIKKLQVNMANIRKKLGVRPGENRYIINELGVGYRMHEENEKSC